VDPQNLVRPHGTILPYKYSNDNIPWNQSILIWEVNEFDLTNDIYIHKWTGHSGVFFYTRQQYGSFYPSSTAEIYTIETHLTQTEVALLKLQGKIT